MDEPFFSYDPEDGFDTHKTADEARARAQHVLNLERDEAREGWSDYVEAICWGRIKEQVVEVSRKDVSDDPSVPYDTEIDYALHDIENPDAQRAKPGHGGE